MYENRIHYNYEIESAILGACLIEKTAVGRVYQFLKKEYFYKSAHQEIWYILSKMYEHSMAIDLLTVVDVICRKKRIEHFENIDAPYYLTCLTNKVVSTAHLEPWAYLVREMWADRQAIDITHSGFQKGMDRKEVINQINEKLNSITSFSVTEDWHDMSASLVNLLAHQEKMQEVRGMGITTGIKELDRSTGGFFGGNFIVIGARPSVGKSAYAGQLAIEIARTGKKVGFLSLEMSNTEVAARIAAIDTDTDFNLIFRGLIKDETERENFYRTINEKTAKLPIFISDKTGVNINEIKSKATVLKHKNGIEFLIIDYLQLIDGDNTTKNRNREQEVSVISRGLKVLAKDLDIPVLALCQLNREVTKRKGDNKYPELSDLRESGSLEQDADVVMFLHSEFMSGNLTDENGNSTENERDIIVRKWRNGQANVLIKLDYEAPKMKFKERNNFRPVTNSGF